MTATELIFALFNLALIGLAVSAMLIAASRGLESSEGNRQQLADTRTVMMRLSEWVRQSKRVVAVHEHPASRYTDIILWTDDERFPGQVNLSEIKLLRHDKLDRTFLLCAAEMSESEMQNPYVNRAYSPGIVSSPLFPLFLNLNRRVENFTLAENVTGLETHLEETQPYFHALELQLSIKIADGSEQLEVISVGVRAPDASIDFANGKEGA